VSNWLSPANWFPSILPHLGFLLALVLMASLLQQRRSPSSTIAWLLVILLLPYVGVPLYLIFGGRKMRRMAGRKAQIYQSSTESRLTGNQGTVDQLLASYGVPPATAGNCVQLVTDGHDAYAQVLKILNEARSTIHVTTYILGRDDASRALLECLARQARAGVSVQLLIDDWGSWRVRRWSLTPLIDAGAEVSHFMPVFHAPFRGRANLRNHRKLVVVDGRIALTGGMNLAWPYIGPPEVKDLWLDLSVVVEGPAVAELEALFASDWQFATGKDPTGAERPSPASASAACEDHPSVVQVVASGPDVAGDPLYESLLALIFSARSRIWIVTPYYVPDEMLSRALGLAARRGVDVRVILPEHSNHLTADLARASYLRDLHNAGGRVLLYRSVMLHAKAVVFDYELAVIGSANMDMRSLFLNFEVALFVSSPERVEEVSAWARGLIADSQPELPTPGWPRELAENVVRLLSPLL
jgi:cardiolipin synthase